MPPRTGSRKPGVAPTELDEAEEVGREPRRFSRGRLSRGKGLRKTTGCLACRRRHVRCDEVKPACGGCARRQEDCVYLASRHIQKEFRHIRHSLETIPSSSSTGRTRRTSRTLSSPETSSVHAGTASHGVSKSGTIPSSTPPASSSPPLSSPQQPSLPVDEYPTSSPTVELERPEITEKSSLPTTSESPTAQWLGLLLGDALRQDGFLPGIQQFETEGLDIFRNSRAQSPAPASAPAPAPTPQHGLPSDGTALSRTLVTGYHRNSASMLGDSLLGTSAGPFESSLAAPNHSIIATAQAPETTHNSSLQERIPRLGRHQLSERQVWHSVEVIELLPREQFIFRHFVQTISQWVRQLHRDALFDIRHDTSQYLMSQIASVPGTC